MTRWDRGVEAATGRPHSIKIIRVLGRLNIGGPAIHAVLLTEGLNNERVQSILVTGTVGPAEGDMLYFARQHGVTPVIIPELGREISWRNDLAALWKLYRLLAREQPDVVHTHTAKAGTLGRVAAVLAGVPVLLHTFHGHIFHGYFSKLKTTLFILIERLLGLVTTRIVAISETQRSDLVWRYRIASAERCCVIPLGLDLTPFLAEDRFPVERKPSIGGTALTIGFVGRLVPVKNPTMALNVVAQLIQKPHFQEVKLVIAGDGELRAGLQEDVRRSGLEAQVLFAGWKEEPAAVYSSVDLIILTSVNEGTPVVLIEAMAAGLPFVATRVGGVVDLVIGIEQIIRDKTGQPLFSLFANGVLVQPENVEGFVAAVAFLLGDSSRMRQMGWQGRNFVKDRFSKERLVGETEALYRECLVSRRVRTEAA